MFGNGLVSKKWVIILSIAFILYAYGSTQYRVMKEKDAKNLPAAPASTAPADTTSLKQKATDVVAAMATSEPGKQVIERAFKTNGPLLVENKPSPAGTPTKSAELQMLDSVIGQGNPVSCGQAVTVHYSLFLEDGSMLDSTRQSNHPVTFMVGKKQVIRGLEQGVIGMQKQGIRKLTIPPQLAYDDPRFATKAVPALNTVKAEVELLNIIPAAAMAPDINCK